MTALMVVRLRSSDWQTLRALRVAALTDAPDAFGSSLPDAQRFTETDWRAQLDDKALFAARVGDRHVGIGGGIAGDDPRDAELISMWVDPHYRGRAVGDGLVSAVVDWARRSGYASVTLWATVGNAPAQRLYERHGFRATAATQPVRDDEPALLEFEMVLDLDKVAQGTSNPLLQ
jgi:ribosomal protein S18 acetylase RimI-like enzyme